MELSHKIVQSGGEQIDYEYHSKYFKACLAEVHSYEILKMFCCKKFLCFHQPYQ